MKVDEVSRMMNLYMLQGMMGSTSLGSSESTGTSSSNNVLFEYILKTMMEKENESTNKTHSCCSHNESSFQNNQNTALSSTSKGDTLSISDDLKAKYPEFNPNGVAPTLSDRDKSIMPRIDAAINQYGSKYGVDSAFIKAMIKQESSFNPNSKSHAGAMGLMQLMPYNAKTYGVNNPYNIEENIKGGVKYIKELLDKFDGNKQLALSAYNGGITRMRSRGVDTIQEIVKMPKETRDYVTKVMGYYSQYKV